MRIQLQFKQQVHVPQVLLVYVHLVPVLTEIKLGAHPVHPLIVYFCH